MPLLNKKSFVPSAPPNNMHPDEEIFVCKATNEAFRDYEDFFQRSVQCNSQMWTCEYSGRTNLTYDECLASEREALDLFDSFPDALKRPVLALVHRVRRAGLHHVVEDVVAFYRDRFVVGETISVSYAGRKTPALVVASFVTDHLYCSNAIDGGDSSASVVAPDDAAATDSPSATPKYYPAVVGPNPALYIYELEYLNPLESHMMPTVLPGKFLSRKKSTFTREKTKLFLKLCLSKDEGTDRTLWFVRSHLVVKYGLDDPPLHSFHMMINPLAYPPEPVQSAPSVRPPSSGGGRGGGHAKRRKTLSSTKSGQMIPLVKGLIPKSSPRSTADKSSSLTSPGSMQRTMQVLHKLGQSSISAKERRALWEKELVRRQAEREAERTKKKQEQEALKAKRDRERLKRREERQRDVELGKTHTKEKGKRSKLERQRDAELEKLRRKKEKEEAKEQLRLEKESTKEAQVLWLKPRDDLECSDHKPLPKPSPVQTRLPMEHFGDALMLLQAIYTFKQFLDVENYFKDGGGISFATVEDALLSLSMESSLFPLLTMLLKATFRFLEAEEECKPFDVIGMNHTTTNRGGGGKAATATATTINSGDALENDATTQDDDDDDDETLGLNCSKADDDILLEIEENGDSGGAVPSDFDLRQTARDAFLWPLRYQGTLLSEMNISALTITEIVRLHFMSAGGRAFGSVSNFRYVRRGAFTDWDDPACELKCCNPMLVKRLETISVFELTVGEKLEILNALTNQLLTFAAVRDFMENGISRHKQTKKEFKELQQSLEKKRKQLIIREKLMKKKKKKKKKGGGGGPVTPAPEASAAQSVEEDESKRGRKRRKTVVAAAAAAASESKKARKEIAEEEAEATTLTTINLLKTELEKMIETKTELIERLAAERSVRRLTPLGTDRAYQTYWTFASLPGVFVEKAEQDCWPLLAVPFVLYADSTHCDTKWAVYNDLESVDALIRTLNSRGLREKALKEQLKAHRSFIALGIERSATAAAAAAAAAAVVATATAATEETSQESSAENEDTPTKVAALATEETTKEEEEESMPSPPPSPSPEKTADVESIENVRSLLLEMEDKVWNGNLGAVRCQDRAAWRNNVATMRGEMRDITKAFASAMLDIEAGIDRRFITTPLCAAVANQKSTLALKDARNSRWLLKNMKQQLESGCLDRWQSSLATQSLTGLSQLAVYMSTLDRSILWPKSVLNASCRLCNKADDAHLMLLCDGCDCGHHTYCLNPPMEDIPDGDWFCSECQEEQQQRRRRRRSRRGIRGDDERSPAKKVKMELASCSSSSSSSFDFGDVSMMGGAAGTRRKSADARGSDADEQLKMCEKLWKELKNHDESWPFLEPVNRKANPDYYEIIKNPVDLQVIRHKLNVRQYSSPREFSADVRLMFQNCSVYNEPRSSVYRAGTKLGRFFEKRLGQIGFSTPMGYHETRRSASAAVATVTAEATPSDLAN